ncbi:MAG: DUF3750 domain-containing protein, partial [Deltaproteobacteria bacterium]|nr:DUF3750 domain-containing protein [Deltaproteobacteria bacterium]
MLINFRRVGLALLFIGLLPMASPSFINLGQDYRTANRDSAGIAPKPEDSPEAVVQVYSARA